MICLPEPLAHLFFPEHKRNNSTFSLKKKKKENIWNGDNNIKLARLNEIMFINVAR